MKFFIAVLLVFFVKAQAAFESTSLRYLSGHEVLQKLSSIVPQGFINNYRYGACGFFNEAVMSSAGFLNPATGSSIYIEPSEAFVQWYERCVNELVSRELENSYSQSLTLQDIERTLGPFLPVWQRSGGGTSNISYQVSLKNPTDAEFLELIRYFVERVLGPDEVLREFGYIKNPDEFREKLLNQVVKPANKDAHLTSILKALYMQLLMRDEFLSY